MYFCLKLPSASSWGCELKCTTEDGMMHWKSQPLREAVSWNNDGKIIGAFAVVVSLFVRLWVEIHSCSIWRSRKSCQPLREAVSWNSQNPFNIRVNGRQPLREAVSWNEWYRAVLNQIIVSLFVRLWVEMRCQRSGNTPDSSSASSWGCELKYDKTYEHPKRIRQPLREAVSWNVCDCIKIIRKECQPLREAVSWNVFIIILVRPVTVSLFVRLWVEITVEKFSMSDIRCQPLREAVSWNIQGVFSGNWRQVSLFVRLWVEICKLKYEQSYGYKFQITGNCRENFAWKNSVNGIVQCLRPVRNDHGFVALLYGSGHQSCLLLPRHGRTTVMKYVRNRCRR